MCITLLADRAFPSAELLAHPTGLAIEEPWYLVTNAPLQLDLVWSYARRFWCEALFRDQKSGLFQLESSGLRHPERMDRLLLVIAIAMLVASLQGCTNRCAEDFVYSLGGLRRQVDPHWKRGISFARIGLKWLHQTVSNLSRNLLAWGLIPLPDLEPCIPSRGVHRRRCEPWFARVELPSDPPPLSPLRVA